MHNLFKTLAQVGHMGTCRPQSAWWSGTGSATAPRSIHADEGSAVTGMAASARESSSGSAGRDPGLRRSGSRRDAGAPLTVAAVAARLGVAASTLRTWDRRYGLGPSSHEAGSHRRYTPADVARLERMRHLTLQGVAPSDAAQAAIAPVGAEAPRVWAAGTGGPRHESAEHLERLLVAPPPRAAAAMEPDEPRVHRMLDQEVRDVGIVRTWTKLAKPALTMLTQRERSDRPGVDPEAVITAAV